MSPLRRGRDAERNRDAPERFAGRTAHQFLAHDRVPDVLGDGHAVAQARARQEHGEFLAAITRGDVPSFEILLQRSSDEPRPGRR